MTATSIPIGIYAGTLALIEGGLGSLLHAWHVPLAGTVLSLNQGMVLSFVTRGHRSHTYVRTAGFQISYITALLKSLSPAGKRLTPMLAIAAQGLLFSVGCCVFGPNLLGVVIGSALLALWGIFQPVALTALAFGLTVGPEGMVRIIGYYENMFRFLPFVDSPSLASLVALLIATKVLVASCLAVYAWYGKAQTLERAQARLVSLWQPKLGTAAQEHRSLFIKPLAELRKPVFLVPLFLTAVFYWFAEDSLAPALWATLRPLACAYLILLLVHLSPWQKLAEKYRTKYPAFTDAVKVLESLKERSRGVV